MQPVGKRRTRGEAMVGYGRGHGSSRPVALPRSWCPASSRAGARVAAPLLVPSQQQSRGAGCSTPPGAQPAAEQGRGLQHPSWCPASASSQASKEKARKDWQREQAGTPQLQLTGSDKR